VLKVEAHGDFDPSIPAEPFALATQEQFEAVDPPVLTPQLVHANVVSGGAAFEVEVQVSNNGEVRAHDLEVTLDGVTILEGPNPALITGLSAGDTATVQWTVQAPALPGSYDLGVDVVSTSYGETFTGDDASSFDVTACVGDLNGDGSIGQDDLGILLGDWGCTGPDCDGDIDGDGDTDQADLGALLGSYGEDCP
jgi:hypothetical protein